MDGVSPVVKSYALFGTDVGGGEDNVEIIGLDPVRHSQVTNFGQTLDFRGKQLEKAFVPTYDPNLLGCIVGIDRTTSRNARGQYVRFSGPFPFTVTLTCFPLTAKGALFEAGDQSLVNTKQFSYSDDCHTGIAQVDTDYVYLPLEQAQALCMDPGGKRITALHIKFRPDVGETEGCRQVADLWHRFRADKAGAPNSNLLNKVNVQSWKEYRRAVIAPTEQEQLMLSLMFILVGITTVFIVFVVFYMLVNNKKKDIGVLKSVGASNTGVLSLFQGFAFGIGSDRLLSSGMLFGWLFLSRINRIEQWSYEHFGIQLWDRTMYVIGAIPNHVDLSVLAAIISLRDSRVSGRGAGAELPGGASAARGDAPRRPDVEVRRAGSATDCSWATLRRACHAERSRRHLGRLNDVVLCSARSFAVAQDDKTALTMPPAQCHRDFAFDPGIAIPSLTRRAIPV